MSTLTVREGEVTWLPSLRLSDLPAALPSGIRVLVDKGTLGIEAQGLAGAIPLSNGDTLRILPKIGRVNFLRLLLRSLGSAGSLPDDFDSFVELAAVDDRSIDGVLSRQMLRTVSEILSKSPKFGRESRVRRGSFAVGSIDVTQTSLRLASRSIDPVVYRVKERTPSTPENRVITEAVLRAWANLTPESRAPYQSTYVKWNARFPRSRHLLEDLHDVHLGFSVGRYGGSRDYYRRALMLAQVILGSDGLSLEGNNTVLGDAILLNTSDVFEKYLRSVISAAYIDRGLVVSKGGVGQRSLYTNGSFSLDPDIVITRGQSTALVLDAKYKLPSSDDHYQMTAYLQAYGVSRGVLLAPNVKSEVVEIRKFETPSKLVVWEVYLPMSQLDVTEEFLGRVLEKFS